MGSRNRSTERVGEKSPAGSPTPPTQAYHGGQDKNTVWIMCVHCTKQGMQCAKAKQQPGVAPVHVKS